MTSLLQPLLSPSSSVLPNTALLISLLPLGIGVYSLASPLRAFSLLDPRPLSSPESRKIAANLMFMFGARDVFLGATAVWAWALGDRKLMGWIMLSATGIVGVDGLVQRWQTGGGEWEHWGLAPVTLAIGFALLGWLDWMV